MSVISSYPCGKYLNRISIGVSIWHFDVVVRNSKKGQNAKMQLTFSFFRSSMISRTRWAVSLSSPVIIIACKESIVSNSKTLSVNILFLSSVSTLYLTILSISFRIEAPSQHYVDCVAFHRENAMATEAARVTKQPTNCTKSAAPSTIQRSKTCFTSSDCIFCFNILMCFFRCSYLSSRYSRRSWNWK